MCSVVNLMALSLGYMSFQLTQDMSFLNIEKYLHNMLMDQNRKSIFVYLSG